MTCEDCLYKGFCENKYGDTDYFDDEDICSDVENLCGKFKDKSRMIELPLKIDEVCYCIQNGKIDVGRVFAIVIDGGGITYDVRGIETGHAVCLVFNESVFLTREQAEKALRFSDT